MDCKKYYGYNISLLEFLCVFSFILLVNYFCLENKVIFGSIIKWIVPNKVIFGRMSVLLLLVI